MQEYLYVNILKVIFIIFIFVEKEPVDILAHI